MADTKISALSAGTAVGGAEKIPGVQSAANVYLTPEQITAGSALQAYFAGRWYWPPCAQATGSAIAAGVVKFYLVPIYRRITISDFGARVVTGAASSHLRCGIYASDATTGMPTGNALGSGILDTGTSATTPTITLGGNISLTPGLYWFASQSDGTPTLNSITANTGAGNPGMMIGSSSMANLSPASLSSNVGFFFNSAYAGGFPDMTSNSVTELSNSTTCPVIAFKVTSVP